jgi:hypothetical protein
MSGQERWRRWPRLRIALGCALFALCGPVPVAWAQTGPTEAARLYSYCRARADTAFQQERHIDQDILATLGNNWQRAGTLPLERSQMFADAADRADTVLALCLHAYGFVRAG